MLKKNIHTDQISKRAVQQQLHNHCIFLATKCLPFCSEMRFLVNMFFLVLFFESCSSAMLSIVITVHNEKCKQTKRDMPDQVVTSEHMSVHASLLVIQSMRLNLESIDTIRPSLI